MLGDTSEEKGERSPTLRQSRLVHRESRAHSSRASNENKMSDGGRGRASLRVEGGISREVRNQSGQPFAPSHG